MSFYRNSRSLPERFRLVLASFLQRPGLPFADALPEEAIQKAFDDEEASFADEEDAVYTPAVTLWAFLSQVLFKDHVAVGAGGGHLAAPAQLHRSHAGDRRELAGHCVERRFRSRESDRGRPGEPARPRRRQSSRSCGATRSEASSETARLTHQTTRPSSRRTARAEPGEIAVSTYKIGGSAILA